MKKFNINDKIYIQITEEGWNHLKRSFNEQYVENNKNNHICQKIINGEIWYEIQCWSAFSIFPPELGRPLFKTTIMFDDKYITDLESESKLIRHDDNTQFSKFKM